jgi:hypothetical protein
MQHAYRRFFGSDVHFFFQIVERVCENCGFPEEACSVFLDSCVVVMRLCLCVMLMWRRFLYRFFALSTVLHQSCCPKDV